MPTGPETICALKNATSSLPRDSIFAVRRDDAGDLFKLKISDLDAADFDRKFAEKIAQDFNRQSIAALGKYMGLKLVLGDRATPLICEF